MRFALNRSFASLGKLSSTGCASERAVGIGFRIRCSRFATLLFLLPHACCSISDCNETAALIAATPMLCHSCSRQRQTEVRNSNWSFSIGRDRISSSEIMCTLTEYRVALEYEIRKRFRRHCRAMHERFNRGRLLTRARANRHLPLFVANGKQQYAVRRKIDRVKNSSNSMNFAFVGMV